MRKSKVKNQKSKVFKGFTLIELLVAVSIIGVLATLLIANYNAVRERGRDTQRKSDLRQLQNALRLYYNDHGVYPTHSSSFEIVGCGLKTARTACPWGSPWQTDEGDVYMNKLPEDPKFTSYLYERLSLDSYKLTACIENLNDGEASSVCPTTREYVVQQ